MCLPGLRGLWVPGSEELVLRELGGSIAALFAIREGNLGIGKWGQETRQPIGVDWVHMGAGDHDKLPSGLGNTSIERSTESEFFRSNVDHLHRVAGRNGDRGIGRSRVNQDDFYILNRLLQDPGQQATDVLFFVVGPDHNRTTR
jgi:hypothetical protein